MRTLRLLSPAERELEQAMLFFEQSGRDWDLSLATSSTARLQ